MDARPVLRLGHSPDPDDAFMWFPVTGIDGGEPLIDTGRFRFEAVRDDIESLNRRAETGELEITAISIAHYPRIAERYLFTACGASMGEGYGPRIVARQKQPAEWLLDPQTVIAVPGRRTSAFLTLSLMLATHSPGLARGGNAAPTHAPDDENSPPASRGLCETFRFVEVPFDEIIDRVAVGEFDAGLVIHEGQLTHEQRGLVLLADLGEWWTGRTGLPLPLGGNVVRRDLESIHGPGTLKEIAATLKRSVEYALEHREEAIAHALRYGRGLDLELADRFVSMYVNRRTLDFGPMGREAVRRFLGEAAAEGLLPPEPAVDFVGG